MSNPTARQDVKSDEEWAMVLWLLEAVEHGLVEAWGYEPKTFVLFQKQTYTEPVKLKTKTKLIERTLHREGTYTPDFWFRLLPKGHDLLGKYFKTAMYTTPRVAFIDIKGTYNPYQNDQRYFSLVQKVMFDKRGIWVQKVIPFRGKGKKDKKIKSSLFYDTFAPNSIRYRKDGKGLNACGKACCGIVEFIDK